MIYYIIIGYVLSDHTRKIFLIGLFFFDPTSASFSEWAFTSHRTKLRSLHALFTLTNFSVNTLMLKGFPICNVGLSYTGSVKVFFVAEIHSIVSVLPY